MAQTPSKLRHSSLAARLAWAALILGVIAPLVFVLAGGPEWVVKDSNTVVMWVLTWLFVGAVPVGSRIFTPWIGGAIDKTDPGKIAAIQKKRVITLAPAMYLATVLILWDKDLLSQMYINFIILGIATNVAALQEMWRKGLTKPVSKFTTGIVALAVPAAIGGLVLNICMVFIGSSYKHSMVAWIFKIVPEIVVRPLLPLCYEVCFLTGMGIILTRRMPWSWERARLIAGVVINYIAALLFFIWAGGEIGNILADNYAATAHAGLPQGLVHILAICVIVRAPSYLVGGLGATWNAAGMNERIKKLLLGWLQFSFDWLMPRLIRRYGTQNTLAALRSHTPPSSEGNEELVNSIVSWLGTANIASALLLLVRQEWEAHEASKQRLNEQIQSALQQQREAEAQASAAQSAMGNSTMWGYAALTLADLDTLRNSESEPFSAAEVELSEALLRVAALQRYTAEGKAAQQKSAELRDQFKATSQSAMRLRALLLAVEKALPLLGKPPTV
jgi:hypothetical protein